MVPPPPADTWFDRADEDWARDLAEQKRAHDAAFRTIDERWRRKRVTCATSQCRLDMLRAERREMMDLQERWDREQ